jgi:hypothetical protein
MTVKLESDIQTPKFRNRRNRQIVRQDDGRLQVQCWYADRRPERTGHYVAPGKGLFDVPFSVWEQHIGKTVDLSKWEGSGEGMIGGSTSFNSYLSLACREPGS